MSIYVSGSIYFAGDAIELREKASFSIQRAALDNGFGITFERGFFEEKGDKYQHTFPDNRLFYELNDSPMIGNPEDLFSVNIWSRDGQSIVNEPVFSRMKRIENFLKRILENPCIERIFLEVDPCGGCFDDSEYAYHEDITVDQFASVMTALYEKERIAVPAVQLQIALSASNAIPERRKEENAAMEIKEKYIKTVEILEDACFAELRQKGQEEELGIFLGCFGNRIFQDGSPTDQADYELWEKICKGHPECDLLEVAFLTLCVFDRQFGFILGNAIEWLRERIMQEGKSDPYCVDAPSDPEKYHSTTVVLEQCYEGIAKAGRHGDLAMICGTFCPNNRLRFLSPIDPRLLRIWENVLRTFPDADSTGITYQFLLQCDAELSYGLGYAIAWFER